MYQRFALDDSVRNLALGLVFGSITVTACLGPTINLEVIADAKIIVKMHGTASVGVGPSLAALIIGMRKALVR